ncbi:MAG TPA: T9SS type A sorting domain-containing protein [Fluviicola sp.]|nr:T9SS type A sorting domain-containing protein [Fluviicola sp.]
MGKIYFLSAFAIGAALNVVAQPTLTAAGITPTAGESFITYNCPYMNPGTDGAGVTFDLSGLVKLDTTFVNYAGGDVTYPGSNLSVGYTTYEQTDYTYMNASASGVSYVGMFLSDVVSIQYQDEMELHTFPLTYNYTNTDQFHATFPEWERSGVIGTTATAYGTLITPEGTFTDVLRVHYVQNYTDSSSFAEIDFVSDVYLWYKEGFHHPLASVGYYTTAQGGISQYATYLETGSLGLTEEDKSSLTIYPNPVVESAIVGLKPNEVLKTLILNDMNGRAIDFAYTLDTQAASLDLRNLAPGLYLIELQYASGETGVGKIQVK